jgi:hypothetical protein
MLPVWIWHYQNSVVISLSVLHLFSLISFTNELVYPIGPYKEQLLAAYLNQYFMFLINSCV